MVLLVVRETTTYCTCLSFISSVSNNTTKSSLFCICVSAYCSFLYILCIFTSYIFSSCPGNIFSSYSLTFYIMIPKIFSGLCTWSSLSGLYTYFIFWKVFYISTIYCCIVVCRKICIFLCVYCVYSTCYSCSTFSLTIICYCIFYDPTFILLSWPVYIITISHMYCLLDSFCRYGICNSYFLYIFG